LFLPTSLMQLNQLMRKQQLLLPAIDQEQELLRSILD
jgi:hypothetical protein